MIVVGATKWGRDDGFDEHARRASSTGRAQSCLIAPYGCHDLEDDPSRETDVQAIRELLRERNDLKTSLRH